MDTNFGPQEKLIGHISTASGSLLLADGAIQTSIKLSTEEIVCMDVDKEQHKIPVYAVKQKGKRFLLISIDDASPIEYGLDDKIKTTDTAPIPEAAPEEPTDE